MPEDFTDPLDMVDLDRIIRQQEDTRLLTDGRTQPAMTVADMQAEKAAACRAHAERYALLAVGGFRRQVMG
jgi:hypothetical protein